MCSKMENRKCLSHWRQEQEVKPEFENTAKNPGGLLEKEEVHPVQPSTLVLFQNEAQVACTKTTGLLPVTDPVWF